MIKKYIVSGGSGFIGSHIVDKLIDENNNVVVIDNNSNNRKPLINSKAEYHNIDIADNYKIDELSKILNNCDGIFHCAALIDVQESIDKPSIYELNNTLGTLNLLQAAVKANVKNLFILHLLQFMEILMTTQYQS
jgi:UDP-glucose 4-epimerase